MSLFFLMFILLYLAAEVNAAFTLASLSEQFSIFSPPISISLIDNEKQKLEKIRQRKIEELKMAGIPDKYVMELQRA